MCREEWCKWLQLRLNRNGEQVWDERSDWRNRVNRELMAQGNTRNFKTEKQIINITKIKIIKRQNTQILISLNVKILKINNSNLLLIFSYPIIVIILFPSLVYWCVIVPFCVHTLLVSTFHSRPEELTRLQIQKDGGKKDQEKLKGRGNGNEGNKKSKGANHIDGQVHTESDRNLLGAQG